MSDQLLGFLLMVNILVLAAGLGFIVAVAHKRRDARAWGLAARRAGIKDVVERKSVFSSLLFKGRVGTHVVRLEQYRASRHTMGRRLILEGDSGITLRPEDQVNPVERALSPREIEIGDARFDREVYVHGDEGVVRAVLDAATRRLLLDLLQGTVPVPARGSAREYLQVAATIRDGDLVVHVHETADAFLQPKLPGIMETLLEAARRLERPDRIADRLIENNRHEPEWRVRLQNLLLLTGSYPRHPGTREALQRGLEDEREEVQLEAALALGADGHPRLLEIACREATPDPAAARAVAALRSGVPLDRAQEILARALRSRRLETARACLETLGSIADPSVVGTLAKVMALEADELGVIAARALGASRLPAAEGPLLQALGSLREEVRVAAAEALGRVGSFAAVLPLKEAGAGDAAVRRAARQAIAEIQARIGPATPGQVSLAESEEAGQLSMAEGESGQLSLAGKDSAGRLSPADPIPRSRPRG